MGLVTKASPHKLDAGTQLVYAFYDDADSPARVAVDVSGMSSWIFKWTKSDGTTGTITGSAGDATNEMKATVPASFWGQGHANTILPYVTNATGGTFYGDQYDIRIRG